MILSDLHDNLKPFFYHGVQLLPHPTSTKGDCIFCGKEGHFFIKTGTGQWNCRRCGLKGNIPVFLSKLYEASQAEIKRTPTKFLKELSSLAKERGIPTGELRRWGITQSISDQGWILPAYNKDGKLANLYKVFKDREGKWKVWGTPGCAAHLFGMDLALANKNAKKLLILEGPWDGMAQRAAFALMQARSSDLLPKKFISAEDTNLLKDWNVISVPGANTFSPAWLEGKLFKQAEVLVFAYDNDHPKKTQGGTIKPGWDGMKRAIKMVRDSSLSPKIARITWGASGYDKTLPDGYDQRDLLKEHGVDGAVRELFLRLVEVNKTNSKDIESIEEEKRIEPIECTSITALGNHFRKYYHFTDNMRDCLTISLAVLMSTPLEGDPIFLRVIGPPGSGKSTIAECLSASKEYVFPVSVITGLHSGFCGTKGGKTASLIPLINRKTMIVKDADTMMSSGNLSTILSDFRDVFDGTSRSQYRHGKGDSFEDIRTTFILCGTDELRGTNRSYLGDRFLDCEIFSKDDSSEAYVAAAHSNTLSLLARGFGNPEQQPISGKDHLKAVTVGYINHLKQYMTTTTIPTFNKLAEDQIKQYGQMLSYLRARVKRDKGELPYRPRPELATRLTAQLTRAAVFIAIVLKRTAVDKEVLRVVKKLTLDTANGYPLDIVRELYTNPDGLSYRQLSLKAHLSEATITKYVSDMQELRIVERVKVPNNSGIRGRDLHLWRLALPIRTLWKKAFA